MTETLNTKPIIDLAQHANLLDSTGTAFTPAAVANPQGLAINFAKAIIASEDLREEQIHESEEAAHDALLSPEAILKRVHKIIRNAHELGYSVTVTADVSNPSAFPHIDVAKIAQTPAPAPAPTPSPAPAPAEAPAAETPAAETPAAQTPAGEAPSAS